MSEAPAAPRPLPGVTYTLGLLTAVNVVNYMDRSIVGVLIQPMKQELGLSDTQVGVISGFSFAVFYAIAGIYLAHQADTRNRVRLMAWCIGVWTAMTALSGAALNYVQLIVARVGVGIGEAAVIPTANATIADLYPRERRTLALSIFTAGAMLGVMSGSWLGGFVAQHWSWRWAFMVAAVPGLPLALLVRYTLVDPPRGRFDGTETRAPAAITDALKFILSHATLLWLIAGCAFIMFMQFGVITWFPAFLARTHGLVLSEVGKWFGIAMGLGTVFGATLGGWIVSRLVVRDSAWMTRLPPWLLLAMWPLYEIALFAPSADVSFAMLTLMAAIGGTSYGPVLASIQTALPSAIRAKGAAVNGFAGSIIGIGCGPLVVGLLSDLFSSSMGQAESLRTALAIAVCAAPVGAVVLALAHRSVMGRPKK